MFLPYGHHVDVQNFKGNLIIYGIEVNISTINIDRKVIKKLCLLTYSWEFPNKNEGFTNFGNPSQVKSIQINTGPVIFIQN